MTRFDFKCIDCEHIQEVQYKGQEVTCEKCGGKTNKLFSPPSIQFKGSGFYVNDSR